MTHAIFDHKAIGASLRKASSLKVEPPQDAGTPVMPAVQQFDEWGMFAGMAPVWDKDRGYFVFSGGQTVAVSDGTGTVVAADTAPCEYLAQDFDPA